MTVLKPPRSPIKQKSNINLWELISIIVMLNKAYIVTHINQWYKSCFI